MRALAYLEWRFAVHQVAAILRSPLRLAIWIPYLLSLGYLAYVRVSGGHGPISGMQLDHERLTGIGGLYVGALGVTIALSASGRVSGFRSAAEALFFSNSGIRPIEMAVWIELRKLLSSTLRWASAFVYYFLIFFPHHATIFGALDSFVTALLAVALLMGVELPVFLLSRGTFNLGIRAFGWLLAAAGCGYAVIGFAGPKLWAPVMAIVPLDPGRIVRSIQNGSPIALVVLSAMLAVMLVAIALLSRDSLPELYAVSRRALAEIRRRQSAVRQTRYDAIVSTPASHIPSGALSLAWKDWIGFRRGHGSFALFSYGCLFWIACGLGLAYASIVFSDTTPLVTLFSSAAMMVLFLAPQGAAAGIASDLGKPLFWLGRDALRTRLAAWTLGRALRGGFAIGLAPLCAGIVLRSPAMIATALPVCFCSYWSLQALGVLLYALFPNPIDGRGPMALLRMLATLVYLVPAFLAGIAIGTLGGGLLLGTATVCAMLLSEGFASLELASARVRESGTTTALASNAS